VDDSSFIRAILEDPASDHPRLVWADALDERGDPRGEFIRVQCELARWPCECDTSEERVYHEECRCKERGELQRRERELAMRRCAAWAETDGVMKALGADHVRRLGLSMGYTDLEFSLDGRHIAIGNFRRGLVGSVTLTCQQFFGDPCWRCGGRPRGVAAPGGGWATCPICRGRLRTEGVAAALFRAAPITEVRLSDREPDAIGNGRLAWWHTDPDWHRPGLHQHHWLPVELRPYLTGRICEPIDEPRPGVCGFNYGDLMEGTDGVGLARADLSAACVALGRARAKLPALARPVSADSPGCHHDHPIPAERGF
jgi:uncharacterized protein (TIGR02996 family)